MRAARAVAAPRRRATPAGLGVPLLLATYLGLVVLLPLAALAGQAAQLGPLGLYRAVTAPEALAALSLTVVLSLAVALIDAVTGTAIAWELERDRIPGRRVLDALLDLPFALPTIVAGLVLLALYGPGGPFGLDLAATRAGVLLALLLVTLPFVVRTVQPAVAALGRDQEEAAATLGAGPWATFGRVVLPRLGPAVAAGAGLAFARAIGEYGAVVLISGNLPMRTELASVYIAAHVESMDLSDAAAVSLVLLALSLAVLLALGRWERGHGVA